MERFRELWRRLAFLFRRRQFENDLEEEMRFHLDMKTREIGRDAARPQFGNAALLREDSRAAWGWAAVESCFADCKYAARGLRKNPGFAAAAVLTMALGIGANAVIFSLVDAVLLRPLPYPQPGRLAHAVRTATQAGYVTMPELAFWKEHNTSFAALAGYRGASPGGLVLGERTVWVDAMPVTADFLSTLGVAPALGREFRPEETRANGPRAIILSNGLWRREFAADSAVLGRVVTFDNAGYTVVGVLPPGFWASGTPDALVALRFTGSGSDMGMNTEMIARLKPSVSFGKARAEMAALSEGFRRAHSGEEEYQPLTIEPYRHWLTGAVRPTLLLLFGATGLLLLIACTNLAGLLLARLAARQKEIAMRLALGSGAGRLLRQFVAENLLLSALGGRAGLAAAYWLLDGFVALVPFRLPASSPIRLDLPVLVFALAIVGGTSVLFSLAPFVNARRLRVHETLKSSGRWSGAGGAGGLGRSLLAVGETALSVTLLISAALLIHSLYRLHQERLGFDPHGVMTFATPSTALDRRHPETLRAFNAALLERLRATPGVRSVAAVSVLPLTNQGNYPVEHAGHPDQDIGGMEIRHVTPEYFATMRTAIVLGRPFDARDSETATPVILVNETVARRWWGQGNPLGDRVVVGRFRGKDLNPDSTEKPREVVGVVGDTKSVELKAAPRPTVYLPMAQTPSYDGTAQPRNRHTHGTRRHPVRRAVAGAEAGHGADGGRARAGPRGSAGADAVAQQAAVRRAARGPMEFPGGIGSVASRGARGQLSAGAPSHARRSHGGVAA
ncbi:MAG TPA: ABC transporter permease [Bryobacteraceae bacterium]|nr:ABC transporter permease [Bryobacteraceae bacterium]